jgi:hypothetical protein
MIKYDVLKTNEMKLINIPYFDKGITIVQALVKILLISLQFLIQLNK